MFVHARTRTYTCTMYSKYMYMMCMCTEHHKELQCKWTSLFHSSELTNLRFQHSYCTFVRSHLVPDCGKVVILHVYTSTNMHAYSSPLSRCHDTIPFVLPKKLSGRSQCDWAPRHITETVNGSYHSLHKLGRLFVLQTQTANPWPTLVTLTEGGRKNYRYFNNIWERTFYMYM